MYSEKPHQKNIRTVAVVKDIPTNHLPNTSQNCHLLCGVSGDCIGGWGGRLLPNWMRRTACEGDDGMPRKYSAQVNIVFTCQKCWGYGSIQNWFSLYGYNLFFISQTSQKYYIPGGEFQVWWLTIRSSGGLLWPRELLFEFREATVTWLVDITGPNITCIAPRISKTNLILNVKRWLICCSLCQHTFWSATYQHAQQYQYERKLNRLWG